MRKILFLILFPTLLFGQSETNVFTTKDTTINAPYGGLVWRFRMTYPTNFDTPNHPDTATRAVIFTIPGQGQMGNDFADIADFGPHWEIATRSWNRAVQLGNGTHYPIYITAISSNTFLTGREAHDMILLMRARFHVPQNKFFVAGLSQGGFSLSAAILYESSAGNESGMKLFQALAAFHGVSNEVTGGVTKPETGWGRWAKQYGGRFFGLEGNGSDNFRNVWRVSNRMQDSMPGSAYFSYTSVGGGSHSGWDTIYSPHQVRWRSVTPFGTYNTGSQGANGINRMGTYVDYTNVYQWLLQQGDSSLAGSGGGNAPPTANAGVDQTITLPISSVFVEGSGTDDVGIVSYAWSKISGPSTFTITSPSAQSTTIFNLVAGTYVFQLTTTDAGGLTGTDQITVTVNAEPTNAAPTVNAGTDQTITLPISQVTLTATANDTDGTIASYLWTKQSGGSATITSSSASSTTVTGLSAGSYTFRCLVTDNDGATAFDDIVVTVNAAPTGGTTYTWNSATTNILINNTIFGTLQAGDSVLIPVRSGGYRSISISGLNSGTPGEYIHIYFQPGAYITPSSSALLANILTGSSGVKVTGMEMQNHRDGVFRLTNYSSYIWIDSLNNNGSAGLNNIYTSTFTAFDGNIANSFHHWKVSNSSFDSLYTGQSGGKAISLGKMTVGGYWFDVEIWNNYFGHYSSASTASIYISADNSYNVKIHDNVFEGMGYEANPVGHASLINTAAGLLHVYNNKFIDNYGNAIRGSFADVPSMGADYTGRGRVYNNLSIRNRKYGFIEPRPVSTTNRDLLVEYLRPRAMPEVYNITVYRPGIGKGNSEYISPIVDCYATDTLSFKNCYLAGVLDTTWGTSFGPTLYSASVGAIGFFDTASNRLIQLYSSIGLQDSVNFRPTTASQLYNTGIAVPAYITTDIYGAARNSGGGVDIGAAEALFINNRKIVPRKLTRATRFVKVE